jgi:hypothetical protein
LKVLDDSSKGPVHGQESFVNFGLFVGIISKHCVSLRIP